MPNNDTSDEKEKVYKLCINRDHTPGKCIDCHDFTASINFNNEHELTGIFHNTIDKTKLAKEKDMKATRRYLLRKKDLLGLGQGELGVQLQDITEEGARSLEVLYIDSMGRVEIHSLEDEFCKRTGDVYFKFRLKVCIHP